jgi:hypothetical protein
MALAEPQNGEVLTKDLYFLVSVVPPEHIFEIAC